MKLRFTLILAFFFAGAAFGQGHPATGVVKRVDPARGVVTLRHGPVKSLDLPGMTMDFRVRDPKLLAGLKANQKVKFEFVEERGRFVIVGIK